MGAALVAIVDDDPRIQDLLGAELSDLNQKHCCYSSGEELLAEVIIARWRESAGGV